MCTRGRYRRYCVGGGKSDVYEGEAEEVCCTVMSRTKLEKNTFGLLVSDWSTQKDND